MFGAIHVHVLIAVYKAIRFHFHCFVCVSLIYLGKSFFFFFLNPYAIVHPNYCYHLLSYTYVVVDSLIWY